MAERSVVGIYDTIEQTAEAIHRLADAGFPMKHVSIVTQTFADDKSPHGFMKPENDLCNRGTVTGACIGGLCSLLVGVVFLWLPGVGPVLIAGRLAALLFAGVEGALAGAASGGFLGALATWGIAEEHILDYERQLQGGKYLVITYGNTEEVATAHAILQGTAARALRVHAGVGTSQ